MSRLIRDSQVLLVRMDEARKAAIETLCGADAPADVTAAWVVTVARERGWDLSANPGRLHLLEPELPVDLV